MPASGHQAPQHWHLQLQFTMKNQSPAAYVMFAGKTMDFF
jgi:hypothetical protein